MAAGKPLAGSVIVAWLMVIATAVAAYEWNDPSHARDRWYNVYFFICDPYEPGRTPPPTCQQAVDIYWPHQQ